MFILILEKRNRILKLRDLICVVVVVDDEKSCLVYFLKI